MKRPVLACAILMLMSACSPEPTVEVTFEDVAGLEPGAAVLLDGYPVGQVDGIELGPDFTPIVSLHLDNATDLPIDSRICLSYLDAIGTTGIRIERGVSSTTIAPGQRATGCDAREDVAARITESARAYMQELIEAVSAKDSVIAKLDSLQRQVDSLMKLQAAQTP